MVTDTLREKYPYSEFFWFLFSRIRTECGEILLISPYAVRMQENTDQKIFEDRHFSSSGINNLWHFKWFISKDSSDKNSAYGKS